ncbi:uncharacterized protein F5147DRAFT_725298, partial [Suillus discolor]
AAAVRSRTTVRTGLLVRFSVVRSMVPSPARTGPESGSGIWTFTSGLVLVRLSRTFPNRSLTFEFPRLRHQPRRHRFALFVNQATVSLFEGKY